MIEDTATAVQEQAIASDEIARNMDAVQRIAQEVLGSSRRPSCRASTCTLSPGELEQSVKGFRVGDVPGTPAPAALPARPKRHAP